MESTASHAVSPTSGCPRAGLGDSVSPLFKGSYTRPALGRQFRCGEGGRGQAGEVGYMSVSIRPSVPLGGRFAKQGKIPERRRQAREGPYMGMGTASCFPADVCAAAPAPPEPPTGTGHPASIAATAGHGSHHCPPHCPSGSGGLQGVQVTAGAQVLPALAQLCPLSASSGTWHSPAPQNLPGVPTYTPVPLPISPPHP